MKIFKKNIKVESRTQIDFINITDQVQEVLSASNIREGQVLVYAPHTTMGVMINHNEPMLIQDFMRVLYRLAPTDDQYAHDLFEIRKNKKSDGRSNGHSHCKSLILGTSKTLPVEKGKITLTEKQSIFAVDFDGARKRELMIQVIGI